MIMMQNSRQTRPSPTQTQPQRPQCLLQLNRIQKRQIAFKKIVFPQTPSPFPDNLLENPVLNFPAPNPHPEKYQQNRILPRVSKFITGNLSPRLSLNPQFLSKLAPQRLPRHFPSLHLPARKLPLQWMRLIPAPPANQDLLPALENPRYHSGHRQDDSLHLWCAAGRPSNNVSPELIDHFRNPRNVGELAVPAITVEVSNPVCGDILRLSVLMESGRVAQVGYKVSGCAASIAAGSALTVLTTGRNRAELALITREKIEAAVGGLSNESKHAAALCVDAVRAILRLC